MKVLTNKKIRLLLFFSLGCTFIFLAHRGIFPGFVFKNSQSGLFNLLQTTIKLIQNDYVEEPDPQKALEGAYKGLIDSLDVLSSYLDQEEITKLSHLRSSPLYDSGVIVYKKYGSFPIIIGIREGSSAEEAGLQEGDLLTSINSQPTVHWSMVETNLALQDTQAKNLEVEVLRESKKLKVTLALKPWGNPPLILQDLGKTTILLKIFHFLPPTASVFQEKISPLLKKSAIPLIIDLRNCAAGEIQEALKVLDAFIQVEEFGCLRQKDQTLQSLACSGPVQIPDRLIIIWTNAATMGAGEIFAAGLQKYRNALVVGVSTPGLVGQQKFFPLNDGTGLLLTTAVFQFPQEKIWLKGVKPTIELEPQERKRENYLKATQRLLNQKISNFYP